MVQVRQQITNHSITHINSYCAFLIQLVLHILPLSDLYTVLIVDFQVTELSVSEAMGTVEVTVMANGTSEFDYTVNLTINNISTGGITIRALCV